MPPEYSTKYRAYDQLLVGLRYISNSDKDLTRRDNCVGKILIGGKTLLHNIRRVAVIDNASIAIQMYDGLYSTI